jgi:diphosphomevalonate decarboxylase
MKSTAVAPSNIAFIKYWGKKDEVLRIPENGSISMCLNNLLTTTTVEFSRSFTEDSVIIDGKKEPLTENRVILHLDRIRKIAGIRNYAQVISQNSFPSGTGLSSSASGFAALTVSAAKAAGLDLSEKELSILARQGSGSACRSIPGGFTEWLDGDTSETSYAYTLYPPDYWDLVDVVAVVTADKKKVSTTDGMKGLKKSPFYATRLHGMKGKIALCKEAIKRKDFEALGELSEAEALEMHAVMITQTPSLLYWTTGTLQLMKLVRQWRVSGIGCYFTVNTGQNIHVLTLPSYLDIIKSKLSELKFVKQVIVNHPAKGARYI